MMQSRGLAVVTGASRGIGAAISRRLARDGFDLAIHYGANADSAQRVVDDIVVSGGEAFSFGTDLGRPDVGRQFWDALDAAAPELDHPEVSVLVNNAGINIPSTLDDLVEADLGRMLQVNTVAPVLITQAALSRLADGGRIINIGSVVPRIASPHIISYAVTKGSIDAFTLSLAQQLAERRITVNAVAPGVIDTDMNASWLRTGVDNAPDADARTPLGRVGIADDIASVVSFLASGDSGWLTGQTLVATGGAHLG